MEAIVLFSVFAVLLLLGAAAYAASWLASIAMFRKREVV